MEFFKKLWEIKMMEWHLVVEYWYVIAITFAAFLIAAYLVYRKTR